MYTVPKIVASLDLGTVMSDVLGISASCANNPECG